MFKVIRSNRPEIEIWPIFDLYQIECLQTRLQNDLVRIEWNVKLFSLIRFINDSG